MSALRVTFGDVAAAAEGPAIGDMAIGSTIKAARAGTSSASGINRSAVFLTVERR